MGWAAAELRIADRSVRLHGRLIVIAGRPQEARSTNGLTTPPGPARRRRGWYDDLLMTVSGNVEVLVFLAIVVALVAICMDLFKFK